MKRGCRIFLFRPPPDEGRKRKMLVVDRRKSSREGSEDDQAPRLRVHLELRAPSSRIKHSQENEEGSLDKSGLIEGCQRGFWRQPVGRKDPGAYAPGSPSSLGWS